MQTPLIKDIVVFVVGVLRVLLKTPFWQASEYTMFALNFPWVVLTLLGIVLLSLDLHDNFVSATCNHMHSPLKILVLLISQQLSIELFTKKWELLPYSIGDTHMYL
jgi:hypothetical protein